MRSALALTLLAAGCATSSPVVVTFAPGVPGESGILTAGEAARPQLRSVSITPQWTGRGCYDVTISPSGEVALTLAVDASSDWSSVRALPLIVPEVVSAVMAVVGAPVDLIGKLLGVEREAMPEPSPLSACSALFED